jgi:outer membrane lipoprotein-sorting protein
MKTGTWASLVTIVLLSLLVVGQQDKREQPKQVEGQQKGVTINEVIQRAAAKEMEFKQARDKYTYRQEMTVETLDGNSVDGEYRSVVDVMFDDQGRRKEYVVVPPQSTLRRIAVTKEDLDMVRQQLPFVLTSDEIGEYNIVYVGQQEENAAHCYVFDVSPKRMSGKKPFFQGRIWVDDHEYHVVKAHGKTMLDVRKKKPENLFPAFTTLREQVDGKYWFPVHSQADENLQFSAGNVHIREIVKYSNYKRVDSSAHP